MGCRAMRPDWGVRRLPLRRVRHHAPPQRTQAEAFTVYFLDGVLCMAGTVMANAQCGSALRIKMGFSVFGGRDHFTW